MDDIETIMNVLLVRFAVIAAVIVVVVLVLFAIAVRLRRRGRWEQTRDKVARHVGPALSMLSDRTARSDRSRPTTLTGRLGQEALGLAARKVQQSADDSESSDHDRTDEPADSRHVDDRERR